MPTQETILIKIVQKAEKYIRYTNTDVFCVICLYRKGVYVSKLII